MFDAEVWSVLRDAWARCVEVVDVMESSDAAVEEIARGLTAQPDLARRLEAVASTLEEAHYPQVYAALRLWRQQSMDDVPHRLMRQDDNGHEFEVGVFASRRLAVLEEQRLARRMHKQHYWVEVVE